MSQLTRLSPSSLQIAEPGLLARQFLSFRLAGEDYAIDILQVQEIRRCDRLTRLPEASAALRGVINLRGTMVPVLDLGDLLALPPDPRREQSVMIVVVIGGSVAGLLVDAVSDVITPSAEQLRPPPDLGGDRCRALAGFASVGERMVLLLDLARLLPSGEARALAA